MRTILIATGNLGKLREIVAVLSESTGMPVRWIGLADLTAPIAEPEEDGATFAENAALKARYYAKTSGLWTLADDSGLEVDALGGQPGVVSARFAGMNAGSPRAVIDAANNRKLIDLLRDVPPGRRSARFRCALALSDGERILATAEGGIEGQIIDMPRGAGGFGYDPHFLIPAQGCTTAELSAERKNALSHRGQALRRIRPKIIELIAAVAPQ